MQRMTRVRFGVGTNIPHAPEQGSPPVTAKKIPGVSTNTQCSQINISKLFEKDIEHLVGGVGRGSKKKNYKCQEDNYKPQQELSSMPRSPANAKHLGWCFQTFHFPPRDFCSKQLLPTFSFFSIKQFLIMACWSCLWFSATVCLSCFAIP